MRADEELSPTYGEEARGEAGGGGGNSVQDRNIASMHAALQAQLTSQLAQQQAALAAAVAAAAQHHHQNNNVIGEYHYHYSSLWYCHITSECLKTEPIPAFLIFIISRLKYFINYYLFL